MHVCACSKNNLHLNKMQVLLYVDDRERLVIPHLESIGVLHEVKRLIRGDYCVVVKTEDGIETPLVCIERKSLSDYAASLKDGRYKNKQDLIEMKCTPVYIVEGAFCNPDKVINGIKFNCIMNSMTRLMIRDGIHIMRTKNELDTAYHLGSILDYYSETTPTTFSQTAEPNILNKPKTKTKSEIVSEMWCQIPWVNKVTARELLKLEIPLISVLRGDADLCEKLKGIKYPSGNSIYQNTIDSVCETYKHKTVISNIISCAPHVGGKRANTIVTEITDWNSVTASQLANIKANNGHKIGKVGLDLYTLLIWTSQSKV
jgi:ERCC4-type nuclease